MDTASNHRAHAQAARRWRQWFGWASVLSLCLVVSLIALVLWRIVPFVFEERLVETFREALPREVSDKETELKEPKARATKPMFETQAIEDLSEKLKETLPRHEPIERMAQELAKEFSAIYIPRADLETLMRDLRIRETSAKSDSERERVRAQMELVYELLVLSKESPDTLLQEEKKERVGGSGKNLLGDDDPRDVWLALILAQLSGQKDHEVREAVLPLIISAGALAVSLLGFLSTTVIAWRSDRRAIRAEARAQEEHAWKRADRETSSGFGL